MKKDELYYLIDWIDFEINKDVISEPIDYDDPPLTTEEKDKFTIAYMTLVFKTVKLKGIERYIYLILRNKYNTFYLEGIKESIKLFYLKS